MVVNLLTAQCPWCNATIGEECDDNCPARLQAEMDRRYEDVD